MCHKDHALPRWDDETARIHREPPNWPRVFCLERLMRTISCPEPPFWKHQLAEVQAATQQRP
jgi:hypothetical protein